MFFSKMQHTDNPILRTLIYFIYLQSNMK